MTVGIMLVTHSGIGEALAVTARQILDRDLSAVLAVAEVPADAELETLRERSRQRLDRLDGDGVLVMTDVYGSSPANLAVSLAGRPGIAVVTGVNLPMLLRALNYAHLSLPEVADKAVEGGLRGVFLAIAPKP